MTPQELIAEVENAERAERGKRGLPQNHVLDFAQFPFAFANDAVANFDRVSADWLKVEPRSPNAIFLCVMSALSRKNPVVTQG